MLPRLMRPDFRLSLLGLASFLSGVAAVGYELLWIRRLGELFGHAVLSIQVVLAIFFLGLGVGAWVGGRVADRYRGTIALYALLEGVIAIAGLLFLPACLLLERVYFAMGPAEWSLGRAVAVKGIASAVLLAVPTLAMGATLPALTRHVVHRSAQLAPRLGWLYGTNTLGAAAAALGTVTWLLPSLGVVGSIRVLVGVNVAALLLALAARLPAGEVATARPEGREEAAAPSGSRDRFILLATAAISGFVAVGLEVGWTRALASRFSSTVYSFAAFLCAFLLALGLGALIVAALDRLKWIGRRTLVVAVCGSGIAALVSVMLLARVPDLAALTATEGLDWKAVERRELLFALLVMAPALLFFGINLPLLVHLVHREVRSVGRELGRVWMANTVGSVAAPLIIGFLVLPLFGIRWTIVALAWIAIAFAAFVLLPWARVRTAAGTWVAVVLGLFVTWLQPADVRLWSESGEDRLVAYREGLMASVAVVDTKDGDRKLRVNNSYELGNRRTRFAQARQGLIPLLLHGAPERVLMIGMGTGSSAGAVAAYGGHELDIVEIVPELRELLPLFADVNEDLALRLERDSSIEVFASDARQFVRATDEVYDVVVGDLFVPWRAGEGAMYTREHFAAVREALGDGGLFCQWLPLYQLREEGLRTIVATFLDVFPQASMWWLYFNVEQPVIGLCGLEGKESFEFDALRARLENPPDADLLQRNGLEQPGPLLGSRIAGAERLRAWVGDEPVETAARPRIEFLAPRHNFARATAAADENVPLILELTAPLEDGSADGATLELARNHQRALALLLGGLHQSRWRDDALGSLSSIALAIEATPDWGFLWWNLEQRAIEALRRGERDGVKALLERTLELDPDQEAIRRLLEGL